ncbi:MAG: hypothetical protein ACFFAD_05000 [Candidatus Hermodarchaeota archaeon]
MTSVELFFGLNYGNNVLSARKKYLSSADISLAWYACWREIVLSRRCRIVYRGLIFSLIALVVSIPIVSARQYSLRSMSAQETPGVIWERSFGGPHGDVCYDLIEVSTGGYALTGHTGCISGWECKIWLVRLDSEGNMLWNQTFRHKANPEQLVGQSLLECADGGFAITGYGFVSVATHYELNLLRTDSDGNQLWNKTYGQGEFYDIVQCSDGGFALFGSTERPGGIGNDDFYLVRTDSDGNTLWNYTYGGTEADLARRDGLVLCDDGGFAMIGVTYSYGSETEVLLVRTDSSGDLLWYQTYGGTGRQSGSCLLETDSGFIIAADASVTGPWMIHTDADGNVISEHEYLSYASWHRSSAIGWADSMVRCSNGGYAIVGTGYAGLEEGSWLLRIDDGGYYIWDNFYSRDSGCWLWAIIESSEGGFVVAGSTAGDGWIMRVADQPIISANNLIAGAVGIGFAFFVGVFVLRRRDKWPGL